MIFRLSPARHRVFGWWPISVNKWFVEKAERFLGQLELDLKLKKAQLDPHWDVDHICYRVESRARYQELQQEFQNLGELLVETEVNGRPISTFRLKSPLMFQDHEIHLLELPAPKLHQMFKEGFEHIEVVCDLPFWDLQKRFMDLQFDLSGLRKNFNQELEVQLGERNLKFHHLSLESVIRLEKNTRSWNALQKSRVLETLKYFDPRVAGTYPLGLENETSDLDILLQAEDLEELRVLIMKEWGHCEGFRAREEEVDGLKTVIVQFLVDYVPFELFAQNRATVRQTAYRHFLAQERALKYMPDATLQRLKDLRKAGVKTEPAFGDVLSLEGDPFAELLRWQKKSALELRGWWGQA